MKRHKAPKVSLPRGILSLDHVGSALETNIFFPAVLFEYFYFHIGPNTLSLELRFSGQGCIRSIAGLFPGYADHTCRAQYYHHTGKLAGDSSNFLNSPEPQTESETNLGKVGK